MTINKGNEETQKNYFTKKQHFFKTLSTGNPTATRLRNRKPTLCENPLNLFPFQTNKFCFPRFVQGQRALPIQHQF